MEVKITWFEKEINLYIQYTHLRRVYSFLSVIISVHGIIPKISWNEF